MAVTRLCVKVIKVLTKTSKTYTLASYYALMENLLIPHFTRNIYTSAVAVVVCINFKGNTATIYLMHMEELIKC